MFAPRGFEDPQAEQAEEQWARRRARRHVGVGRPPRPVSDGRLTVLMLYRGTTG